MTVRNDEETIFKKVRNITSGGGSQAAFCCPGHSPAYKRQSQHDSASEKADKICFDSFNFFISFLKFSVVLQRTYTLCFRTEFKIGFLFADI